MYKRISTVVLFFVCSPIWGGSLRADGEDVQRFSSADLVDLWVPALNARGLAADERGGVIVLSGDAWGRLRHYDSDGRFLTNIYMEGRFATAIAADGKGFLWVECGEPVRRYEIAKPGGGATIQAGDYGEGPGQYREVRAVAADRKGRVFIADCTKGQILSYSPDGKFLRSWSGSGEYTLSRGPWSLTGLAVDSNDHVYVVDQPKRRVVVFDETGRGIRVVGQGILSKPTGVATSRTGHCFVSDLDARSIFVFDPRGTCIAAVDVKSSGYGEIKYPWGMAVDGRGDLWVADAQGDKAYRFLTSRLLWSLREGTSASEPAGRPTINPSAETKISIPFAVGDGEKQPVLVTVGELKKHFARSGGSEDKAAECDWSALEIRVGEKQIPSQLIDLRGDGPGTDDDLLAFQLERAPGAEAHVTLSFSGQRAATGSSQVCAQRADKTQDITLKNKRLTWRILGRDGVIQSVAPNEGTSWKIQGRFDSVGLSLDGDGKPMAYRSRIIASGPVVAGIELFHIGDDGRLIRRLWLWAGEPFIREDLSTGAVEKLVLSHRLQAATPNGQQEPQDLSPDRQLAVSLNCGTVGLITAIDETSMDTDGYQLQRVSSRNLPGRAKASFTETRKHNDGLEQMIGFRGDIERLRWAVGVATDGEEARQTLWKRINEPIVVDDRPIVRRSEFRVLATNDQIKVTDISDGGLCDFYNLNATFPDLSDLMKPDIDEKGFLHPQGTRFVFDDGTPLPQFFGGSVEWTGFKALSVEGWEGPPVGKRGVEYVVDVLARSGSDFVRWHHHDDPRISWILDEAKSTIDPKGLDIFHYFLDRCRNKGIHVNFGGLLIARPFEKVLPNLKYCYGTYNYEVPENIVPLFHAQAIQMQKDFATNLLTSWNPYRKCKVVDDPTLAMLEIENERMFLIDQADAGINHWEKLPEPYLGELTALWNTYLVEKYKTRDELAKTWSTHPLEPAEDPIRGSVGLPTMGDVAPGVRSRPDPRISDGREFVYWLHRRYLKTMYDHLRRIGFKGVIFSNGDEANLSMRRAAAEVLDATATAAYATSMRLCYNFGPTGLPPVDKPSICREWGPRNDIPDSWWSILPHAVTARYLDQTYQFTHFTTAHVGIDHMLPSETVSSYAWSGVAQNPHPTSAIGLMAGALAFRFAKIDPPPQRVEVAVPYDDNFFDEGASPVEAHHEVSDTAWFKWQSGKREQVKDIPPLRYFSYWPTRTRFVKDKVPAGPNLVTNLPLLPAGDYSMCSPAFLAQPLCRFDRYGRKEISPRAFFERMGLKIGTATDRRCVGLVAGYVDTDREREILYRSLQKMGYKPPVELREFGKVWRTADKTCELNLEKNEFFIDRPDIQALAGNLEVLSRKVGGIDVQAKGNGAVWWVPWSPRGLDRSMIIVAMDGTCDLTKPGQVGFAFVQAKNLEVRHQGQLLFSLQAPQTINLTVKAKDQDNILHTRDLFVTPLRPLSNRLPITVTIPADVRPRVYGCSSDGTAFLEIVPEYDATAHRASFVTPNREDISFYLIRREPGRLLAPPSD